MMPITPSGTRTREISKPFGRVHDAVTSPTGSGSARNIAQTLGHCLDPRLVERHPVDEGLVAAFAARGLDVVPVGFEDRARARFDPPRHGFERGVLLLRRGKRKRARGLARERPI